MKLGVMQPYLFPYLGYFQLINHTDQWVVFDECQYIAKGWVNRNRILHPQRQKQWQYLTIPVAKHALTTKINNIKINDLHNWRAEIIGKLTSYKKRAPNYKKTLELVSYCLDYQGSSLNCFIVRTIQLICDYLGISLSYQYSSALDYERSTIVHSGQWALNIASKLGATQYINPPGGFHIFNDIEFEQKNIQLNFIQPQLGSYEQDRSEFVSGLSIIDILMWNDIDVIKSMLNDYSIMSHRQIELLNNT